MIPERDSMTRSITQFKQIGLYISWYNNNGWQRKAVRLLVKIAEKQAWIFPNMKELISPILQIIKIAMPVCQNLWLIHNCRKKYKPQCIND